MQAIKNKNTKPELVVRKLLHNRGFRYRLHGSKLPGKPDIVLTKYKAIVFIHGCFWHGHDDCHLFKLPKTRAEFWCKKINSNITRDQSDIKLLIEGGWRILIVWECAIKGKQKLCDEDVAERLEEWVISGHKSMSLSGRGFELL